MLSLKARFADISETEAAIVVTNVHRPLPIGRMRKYLKSPLTLGMFGAAIGLAAWAVRRTGTNSLRGKTVLITGGSRGLGFALAQEFGRLGCNIAICARDARELEPARLSLATKGIEVFAAPCDVSDRASVQELVESVQSRFGRIDVLVNNAGVISVAPIENATIADFEKALAVMFWGVLHATFAVLPEMKNRGEGCIATITSIGGRVSVPHMVPYSCAKFAAVAFSEGLRAEVAHYGIRVVTIAPGLMRTGSHLKAQFKGQHEKEAAWFSIGATAPFVSMNARRAARQIVSAIERGDADKTLSAQANMLARINGMFPGLVPNVLAIVNRFLPASTGDAETTLSGAEVMQGASNFGLRIAGVMGHHATREFNQLPADV
jgi:NAD(P)-dependent dehydrogenase (short-subunit alcohol dehydrogenase family)